MKTKTPYPNSVRRTALQWGTIGIVLLVMLGSLATVVYAAPPAAPNAQGYQDDLSLVCAGIVGLAWIGSGIWGMIRIVQKGYLGGLTWGIGCLLFILFGWWAIPIALCLGPVWLGIAAILEPKKRCPYCKNMIAGSATRCEHCHADLALGSSF